MIINIATLIRLKRASHLKDLSQAELTLILGYKNGQFLSNVKRGLRNVPLKMMKRISEELNIDLEKLK
ncbi:MAG: helix-turn-helix transcriptional regulator [Bacteriovorax sp.]|nr:helix-turn-helix transcriptional regulator [Bacteriovorax sp.]